MSYHENPQKALRDLQTKTELRDDEKALLNYLLAMKAFYDETDARNKKVRQEFNHYGIKRRGGYYNWEGNPISLWEWTEISRWEKYVAHTHTNGYRISTIHLGLDHGWINDKPVIFETMIFAKWKKLEDSEIDNYQERYCTKEEAFMGHIRAVNRVMNYI